MSGRPTTHVAFYLPDFNGGGAERAVLEYVRSWPTGAPPVHVLARAGTGELADEFMALPHPVAVLRRGDRRSRPVRDALRLRAACRSRGVTHLVAVLAAPSAALALAGRRGPRLIVSVQNPLSAVGSTGPKGWVRARAMRAVLRRAVLVLPISPGIASEVTALGVASERCRVLPNPIDLTRFAASAEPRVQRPFTVLVAGRLEAQKRVDLAIDAFARARLPAARLLICGEGSRRTALESQIRGGGLEESVQLLGFRHDLAHVMAEADLLLLTSDYEGYGNVVVEALAAGLLVVARDAPHGPRFILDGGKYGRLVDHDDVDGLATALEEMAAIDHHELQKLREAGRRRARVFDVHTLVRELVALLESVGAR